MKSNLNQRLNHEGVSIPVTADELRMYVRRLLQNDKAGACGLADKYLVRAVAFELPVQEIDWEPVETLAEWEHFQACLAELEKRKAQCRAIDPERYDAIEAHASGVHRRVLDELSAENGMIYSDAEAEELWDLTAPETDFETLLAQARYLAMERGWGHDKCVEPGMCGGRVEIDADEFAEAVREYESAITEPEMDQRIILSTILRNTHVTICDWIAGNPPDDDQRRVVVDILRQLRDHAGTLVQYLAYLDQTPNE